LFLWLAVMLRPAAAVLVIVAPLAVVVLGRFRREAWIQGAMIPVLVMMGLLPWAARNKAVLGEWRWLSTRGGVSLYDGLQAGATGGSDLGHTKSMEQVRGLGELEWDAYFTRAAWEAAREDPGRVIRLAGRKFLRTWSLTPNEETHRKGLMAAVSAAWMLPALVFAGVGWWRYRCCAAAWVLLLPVLAFTGLHMIYVGSVRYRVPVMPFVMVFSAAGVWFLFTGILARKRAGA